jgi:sugar phosphate isomerase/epimerase
MDYRANIRDFGMDTISLAGPLEAKLKAVREAGFSQIMLSARDVVGHPEGLDAAVSAVRASGLRVTGFQVLRDFEGLSGHLHDYKVDIAKSMLEMCSALGARVLLVCCTVLRTLQHLPVAGVRVLPLAAHGCHERLGMGSCRCCCCFWMHH